MTTKTSKKPTLSDSEMLLVLQKESFNYFLKEINPKNGLIADTSEKGSAASVASVGMGLSSFIVGVERGFISRKVAVDKTLTILKFFDRSRQGPGFNVTGYKGFYYHFLDMKTGRRKGNCELSTIDTALFMAGVLSTQVYYTENNKKENEIRLLAGKLYLRVDWNWALNGTQFLCHGWKPRTGFLDTYWNNAYSEAHILFILALASPTYPIPPVCYNKWTLGFKVKKIYGLKFLNAGPLFIHQLSQIWLDFRSIKDNFCKSHRINYFQNTKKAILIQQKYAKKNPEKFKGYSAFNWGISSCNGPGSKTLLVDGVLRKFFNYKARGVIKGPDDGTLCPWTMVASMPFSPRKVLKTIRYQVEELGLKEENKYGFVSSFNFTFPKKSKNFNCWVSSFHLGVNQGSGVLMIENYRSELMWKLMKNSPYILKGLYKAGFRGKWLNEKVKSLDFI